MSLRDPGAAASLVLCGVALTMGIGLTQGVAPAVGAETAGNLDAARLQAADSEPQNWFTLGRDGNDTYYSPLKSIDAKNVKQLGYAWDYDLGNPSAAKKPRRS
jgi:quinohemoprotein ethanol dehydrogenase